MKFKMIVLGVSLLSIIFYTLGLIFPVTSLEKEVGSEAIGFIELLWHNLQVEVISILLGIVSLGAYSLTYLFINFFSMGLITSTLMTESSFTEVLRMFIVHGIFEIPAMILTVALGIYIPWKVIEMVKKRQLNGLLLRNMLAIFIVILLLTVLAAYIESIITPKLL